MLTLLQPPPALAAHVALLWWYEGPTPPHHVERMLPTAAMQLVVNLRHQPSLVRRAGSPSFERLGSAVLGGVYNEPFLLPTAQQGACAGVVFRPGGATPFLAGHAAGELLNAHLSLDALWGVTADCLVARLVEAPGPAAGLAALAHTLTEQRRPSLVPHPVVGAAIDALRRGAYRTSIGHLAASLGVSQQHLGRLFVEQVGLAPKGLAQLVRFQTVLRSLAADPAAGWAERALACGYADQAHLSRDFQRFSGASPAAYVARWGARQNHLPLDP